MNPDGTLLPLIDRIRTGALIAGAVGVVLGLIGFATDRFHFDRAYLFSYVFILGITLGSLALLMLHRQLGGAWGFLVRRPLESAAMTLPLMAVLFIPILVDLDRIYPWVNHPPGHEAEHGGNPTAGGTLNPADEPLAKGSPVRVTHDTNQAAGPGSSGVLRDPLELHTLDLFAFKRFWLNPTSFTVRVALYFFLWIVLAAILAIGSRRQDETGSYRLAYGLQALSAPGLVLYFVSVSLAVIDWGMSLEPEWYSSIYGVLLIIGQGVSATAFITGVAAVISRRGETGKLDTPETFNDLGNLMLCFTMFWAYLSFSQFLIIWSGNLAEEIPWYSRRLKGGWQHIGQFLMAFHFFVPFLILLSRPVKRNVKWLWKVAVLMLVAHLVDVYWIIAPSFGEEPIPLLKAVNWLDLAMPVGLGGIWLSAFLWILKGKPLLVTSDPELLPALKQAAGGH